MRFEDLGRVWREAEMEGHGDGQVERAWIADIVSAREWSGTRSRGARRYRPLLPPIMLLVSIPLFGWVGPLAPRPLLFWTGAALLWAWLAYMSVLFRQIRRAESNFGGPVSDLVRGELTRVHLQERRTRPRSWPLVLFGAGEVCCFVGLTSDPWRILGFSLLVLYLVAKLTRLNANRRERVLAPLRDRLTSWVDDLEPGELAGGDDSSRHPLPGEPS